MGANKCVTLTKFVLLWDFLAYHWRSIALILSAFILAVLSMYWAVLFHVEENMEALGVLVVDFDGQVAPYTSSKPLVGPLVVEAAEKMAQSTTPHLGFTTKPPSDFNYDPMQVRQAVFDWNAWAAIIVNPNATALLQQAVEQGNSSYEPLGAAQTIYVQARDETTHSSYVTPQLTQFQTEVTTMFGSMWTRMLMSNSSISRTTVERVPQAVNPAIGFSTFNLRPFSPAVVTPSVSIGLIYLIIIAFFSFAFFLPSTYPQSVPSAAIILTLSTVHMKYIIPKGHPPIHFYQLVIWRWLATVAAYFFMSFFYSIVSLAFQIPFSNPTAPDTMVANNPDSYGKGTFPVYWMLNFVGMIGLGLACENVAMVIGQPWTAMWLIFWVITNVATSFYAVGLAPKFFYWGYAWPLHNSEFSLSSFPISPNLSNPSFPTMQSHPPATTVDPTNIFLPTTVVEASRSMLFNLHSRIGLNFGILFAWAAIGSALFPLSCYFMRWKGQREQKKQQQQKSS